MLSSRGKINVLPTADIPTGPLFSLWKAGFGGAAKTDSVRGYLRPKLAGLPAGLFPADGNFVILLPDGDSKLSDSLIFTSFSSDFYLVTLTKSF